MASSMTNSVYMQRRFSIGASWMHPNFQLVDQVYDGLLARGVSPFVELSFMPKQLASSDRKFGFYGGNISPPKSNDAWANFIKTFVTHLIDRYGLATVKLGRWRYGTKPTCRFSGLVHNSNILISTRRPVLPSNRLIPVCKLAGRQAPPLKSFAELKACWSENNAPIDFFSTHIYAGDDQKKLFGATDRYAQADVIPEAMRRARMKIDATAFRGRPLWLSEWSSDGAMIAHVISNCLPHLQAMSQWVLSGTYEELGVSDYILKEGNTGWSMIAAGGIPKPAFNTYKLLHMLGNERLLSQGPVLASRRVNQSISAIIWNLADVAQPSGIPDQTTVRTVSGEAKRFQVEFTGARPGQRVQVRFVDQERGSAMPAWREIGSPQYIKPDQIQALKQRAEIAPPTVLKLNAARQVTLDLPPEGVALMELI